MKNIYDLILNLIRNASKSPEHKKQMCEETEQVWHYIGFSNPTVTDLYQSINIIQNQVFLEDMVWAQILTAQTSFYRLKDVFSWKSIQLKKAALINTFSQRFLSHLISSKTISQIWGWRSAPTRQRYKERSTQCGSMMTWCLLHKISKAVQYILLTFRSS